MLRRLIIRKNIESDAIPFILFILHAFHSLSLKYFDIFSIETSGIGLIKIRSIGVITTRESISGLNLYSPTILPFSILNSNESSGSTTIEEETSSVSFS